MSTTSNETLNLSRYKGMLMVLIAAIAWGLSGTVAQYLFQEAGFLVGWLVTVRLILAGALLLAIVANRTSLHQVFSVWKKPKDRVQLMIFGILGMLAVQYTYFASIDLGNAATATLLQYLGPLFITVYVALRFLKLPTMLEIISVLLALVGVFLLVTNGSLQSLTVSTAAILWGLGSAVALAFYTLYPSQLLKEWGAGIIVGWGMVIGGIGLSLINPPWQMEGQEWSLVNVLFVVFVILFGTLLAFYLYLESLRYITPVETSLIASAEPLAAAVASIIWLQVPFGIFEMLGGICIIATVTILSLRKG
jgi:drug/metabolite transporter (DMT)-like permease